MNEKEASVPLTDRGLLLGDGLFETLLVNKGNVEWYGLHYDRLMSSALTLRIPFKDTFLDLEKKIHRLITLNSLDHERAVVRLTLTRGCGPRGIAPPVNPTPRLFIHVFPFTRMPSKKRSLMVSSYCLHQAPPLCFVKHLGYQVSVLAKQEAQGLGFDDAILLNAHNQAVCATAANIFLIKDDLIITPPLSVGCLPGIIRGLLIKVCEKNQLPFKIQAISSTQLKEAESIFLSNSLVGIQPFHRFMKKKLDPHHSLIIQLREAYEAYKKGEKFM